MRGNGFGQAIVFGTMVWQRPNTGMAGVVTFPPLLMMAVGHVVGTVMTSGRIHLQA
jgi:hypothetical protein